MKLINANGANIPALGFGTYKLLGNDCFQMVKNALSIGYRHIDTAQIYDNETEVGKAIKQSEVARENIFLTTKIWVTRFRNGDLQKSLEASLKKLQTSYVDLVLLHWPNPEIPLEISIPALNETLERGLTKNIGVSNFNTTRLLKSIELSNAPLATNQVEFHVMLDQSKVRNLCKDHNMALTAYSPLGKGNVIEQPLLKELAANKNATPAQIALHWLYQQHDVALIPKTASKQRAEENFKIFDIELTEDEMSKINNLQSPNGRFVNNEKADPQWD